MNKYAGKFIAGEVPQVAPNLRDPQAFFRSREGLWVSDSFRARVLAKAVNLDINFEKVRHVNLKQDMSDAEIEAMLGDGHVFSEMQVCLAIARLIEAQPKGEGDGRLLGDGESVSLFYLRSCVVLVQWFRGEKYWSVRAWERSNCRWSAGNRAFAPASDYTS